MMHTRPYVHPTAPQATQLHARAASNAIIHPRERQAPQITTTDHPMENAWLRSFQIPPHISPNQHHNDEDHERITSEIAEAFGDDMPPVGGDYEFAQLLPWPQGVSSIENNVFSVTRAYPVARQLPPYDTPCSCNTTCISEKGSALTSPCLNTASC
ncbi:hypothetical protein V7S43_014432 [Phytophthora oleae]|uniref:Uncharacterized protein n=1 Tax=Phytophthora oleae TaxID=2107226 RepID=A0ABD3F1M2_9STRA